MNEAAWRPSLGAWPTSGGVEFRVWAPERDAVELLVESPEPLRVPLARQADGTHAVLVPGLGAGALYRYLLDGKGPFPDPASRFQPQGVHGPSEVVDPAFVWTDGSWSGLGLEELVLYELHAGAFTPEGGFAPLRARLPALVELGVTAVELMPVADFPGRWNWGYDGVCLFAPARAYGRPEELRALVDEAHRLGLGVVLDVVYNHFGPDGAYLGSFSPSYFTNRHRTPWGQAINLDGPSSAGVRRFFVENALHWIHEYHLDGLRLDATHALKDDGEPHFLAELARECRERGRPGVPPLLIAEDHRNLPMLVRPPEEGGYGLDAVWADDLHHALRRRLAGDGEGYFRDFAGTTEEIAAAASKGWLFCGQHSEHFGGPRGADPSGIPARRFVVFLQNHDQVGNRALGSRLHHDLDLPAFRAATFFLLALPETPLLFMGQEWAASAPFLYFTDHHEELGRRVTDGRRREFRTFSEFADPARAERIPDPQAETTFARSRLDWDEREREPHASVLRMTRALLRRRREDPVLSPADAGSHEVRSCGDEGLAVWRRRPGYGERLLLVRVAGAGPVAAPELGTRSDAPWRVPLSSEDPEFTSDPQPVRTDTSGGSASALFARPGAVLLERDEPASRGEARKIAVAGLLLVGAGALVAHETRAQSISPRVRSLEAHFYTRLGHDRARRGDFRGAIDAYRAAIVLPGHPDALHFHLGYAYERTSGWWARGSAEREEAARRAVSRYRYVADRVPALRRHALLRLAALHSPAELDERGALEADLQELVGIDPRSADRFLALARLREDGGRFEEAETTLLAAREAAPDEGLVHRELARFYRRHGRLDAFLAVLENRLRSVPDDRDALFALVEGCYYRARRDHRIGVERRRACAQRGLEAADVLLRQEPDDVAVRRYRDLLSREDKDLAGAGG